jgi:outer membrane protein assembly factor BamA
VQKTILRRAVVALLLATLSPLAAMAQTASAPTTAEPAAFVIESVEYRITGRTRQWVLEDILELEPGRTFLDEEDLFGHLARQRQVLLNQRSLQEATVEAVFAEEAPEATGPRPVQIVVTTRDTWNVIVLPYARYDSNTGLLLSLRGRDYNFFGTLQELAVNLDYERTDEDEDLFTISSEFSIPFNLLERRWRLIFEQDLELEGDEFDLSLALGLGYDFELLGLG